MPHLFTAYTRALNHLTAGGKLPFEQAADQLNRKFREHSRQVSAAKAAWSAGTRKMRILSYNVAKKDLEKRIASVKAMTEKTVDDILLEGQLRQQLHDLELIHAKDIRKK